MIRRPISHSLDNYTSILLPPKMAKIVQHGLSVQSAPITSAEQDVVNMKREEHEKKMKQMDKEHDLKMDILAIKKQIALRKLDYLVDLSNPTSYSTTSSEEVTSYHQLY